jgi:hypothetical protein
MVVTTEELPRLFGPDREPVFSYGEGGGVVLMDAPEAPGAVDSSPRSVSGRAGHGLPRRSVGGEAESRECSVPGFEMAARG